MLSHQFIDRHLLHKSALSGLLYPLSLANSAWQSRRRKRLSAQAWHPDCKVLSIGNITSGGSGKTPLCIYLAELLRDSGLQIGISHRGYRGALEHTPALISDGQQLLYDVRSAGDEAYLLAQRLPGVPIVAGRQRVAAVSLLLASFPDIQAVILDDALQHLRIARDLDIVCFDAETGIGNGWVIPAGYLREPLSAIDPRSLIVVTHKGANTEPTGWEGLLSRAGGLVVHCYLQGRAWVNADGKAVEAAQVKGRRAMLISGIANPDSFERSVEAAGVSWMYHLRYPDHYAFADGKELAKIAGLAVKNGVEWLLCTEKDLAKLSLHKDLRDKLLALRIGLHCPDEAKLKDWVWARLGL